jgi:hypothetical protein
VRARLPGDSDRFLDVGTLLLAEAIREIATQVELTHLLQRLDPNRNHPLAKAMRLLWGEDDDGEQ